MVKTLWDAGHAVCSIVISSPRLASPHLSTRSARLSCRRPVPKGFAFWAWELLEGANALVTRYNPAVVDGANWYVPLSPNRTQPWHANLDRRLARTHARGCLAAVVVPQAAWTVPDRGGQPRAVQAGSQQLHAGLHGLAGAGPVITESAVLLCCAVW